jgi:hypothetical protein
MRFLPAGRGDPRACTPHSAGIRGVAQWRANAWNECRAKAREGCRAKARNACRAKARNA